MSRRLLLCTVLALAGRAPGQVIHDLASDTRGAALYFSTQTGVKGQDSLPYEKIVRWTRENGFGIFAQRERQGSYEDKVSNAYRLLAPQVLEGGNSVAFLAQRDCYSTMRWVGCTVPNIPQTIVVRNGREETFDGAVNCLVEASTEVFQSRTAPIRLMGN